MMTTITRWARWWNIVSKPQTSLGSTQQVLRLLLDLPLHGLPGLLSWLDRCSHPAHHRNPSTGGAKVKIWMKVRKTLTLVCRFPPPCLYMLTTFTSLASWDRSVDECENGLCYQSPWNLVKIPRCSSSSIREQTSRWRCSPPGPTTTPPSTSRSPASAGKCHHHQDAHCGRADYKKAIVNYYNSSPIPGSSAGLFIYLLSTWPMSQRGGPGSRYIKTAQIGTFRNISKSGPNLWYLKQAMQTNAKTSVHQEEAWQRS